MLYIPIYSNTCSSMQGAGRDEEVSEIRLTHTKLKAVAIRTVLRTTTCFYSLGLKRPS